MTPYMRVLEALGIPEEGGMPTCAASAAAAAARAAASAAQPPAGGQDAQKAARPEPESALDVPLEDRARPGMPPCVL